MAMTLDDSVTESLPGLPPYTPLEKVEAELDVIGVDARCHVMELYESLFVELGCTPAKQLAACKNDSKVWVAGVKVASQTPAIRSGQRIIFLTLDDVTGPIDVTIFERAQPRCARTVFHSWIQLVQGIVRKRGGASRRHRVDPNNVGITVVAEEVFDLAEISQDRAKGFSLTQAINRQRRKQAMSTGSGLRTAQAPGGKMWHSSGGSAGR
jgi:DNA polymerase III alpha subunit